MNKTPLNQVHRELDAKLIDFGGWEMPVQYSGILEEHKAVRGKCGLFDVSHMGEIKIWGDKALDMVQKLITNDASDMEIGRVIYSPMCYSDGGIVDDLLVYKTGEEEYLLVVNAANTEKDWDWIQENAIDGVKMENVSGEYAQLALQGPNSKDVLSEIDLEDIDLEGMDYYWSAEGKIEGVPALISRTGYTGELGYEIYLAPEKAADIWKIIMEKGEDYGIQPVGLGARDTLRLEKKFCLYGNDIDSNTHPLKAGLGWTVVFDKDDFIGKEALVEIKEKGYDSRLVGFKMLERGIPRHGYKIKVEGQEVGEVTSGSFSPTLEENIGLGYVQKDKAEVGQEIEIVVRSREVAAEIVETPFV